jgi:hypothetical protein
MRLAPRRCRRPLAFLDAPDGRARRADAAEVPAAAPAARRR